MSKIYANPFFWGGPVNGNTYLARPTEEQQIATALDNQISLVLSGNRGTGKTSILQSLLEKRPEVAIYLDLRFVVSLDTLYHLLLQALGKAFPTMESMSEYKTLQESDQIESLSPVFDFLYETAILDKKRIVMVWDEFHHILKLKDNTIAEIKSKLKRQPGINNVFVSHREDLMQELFGSPKNHFLDKYEHLILQTMDGKTFKQYLTNRFRRMGLNDFDLAAAILEFTTGLPQLTQKVAHSLAQLWLEGNTTSLLDRTIKKMLQEHNALFTAHWDNFGMNERRLLLGLASGHSRPTELGFIAKFGLSATSTAHNTVIKLLREGWLTNRDDGYYLYDPLFLKWLQNRSGIA